MPLQKWKVKDGELILAINKSGKRPEIRLYESSTGKDKRLLDRSEDRKWHFVGEDTVGTGRQHPEEGADQNQDEILLSTPATT